MIENSIVLSMIKKSPIKELPLIVTLSSENKSNIRVYELVLSITPKVIHATIEMQTTARVKLNQELPLSNATDIDCTFKISLQDITNGSCFEISSS